MNGYIEMIGKTRLMPAITINHSKDAVSIGDAFVRGGQKVAEVTLRTEDAYKSISLINENTELNVGAGTVLTIEQASRAIDCGAKFLVSPGLNPKIVEFAMDKGIEILPGVATPSEIEAALSMGIEIMKFFPADVMGGTKMLNALRGPYINAKFIPMGGMKYENMAEYLSCSNVFAIGGTWMSKPDVVAKGAFDEIERMTREALELIKSLDK